MDRKSASFLALGLVWGALLAASVFIIVIRSDGPRADAGPLVFKFAHNQDRLHPVHAAITHFAARVAERSGGALEVRVFPNGQLGSEPECIEQVQRGVLALVKTSAGPLENFVPGMAALSLPYIFRDADHYWRVLDGPIGRELLAAGQPVGIHGLCYYDAGARSFYTVARPILTPADAVGRKLRVQPSKMARDLVAALGAGPTPVPWGELYTALQQNMVDGAENNPPSYVASRHHEVARHFSLNEHARVPDVVIFSQKIWATLTPQQRLWLEQAAADSVAFQRRLWAEKTAEALAAATAAGVAIHRPDPAPFASATAHLIEQFEATPAGHYARRIRATP